MKKERTYSIEPTMVEANATEIFSNEEFGKLTVIEINDEPWFIGKEVAEKLGYVRGAKAISDHVEPEDKDEVPIQDSIGRMQKTAIINESGLYSLIMYSKLEGAKRFKRWVTSEVLPSIRKTGGYIPLSEGMSDDEIMAKALLVANKTIEEKNKQLRLKNKELEEARPKIIFADAVETSKDAILIGDLAKLLKQNGIDIGQNRLFKKLRSQGYLIRKRGATYNSPSQKSMDMGLMAIKEGTIVRGGQTRITKTTKVTGKGQTYFINKFLKEQTEEPQGTFFN